MFRQYFKQAIQMLKENRLTSVISILGTALSIAMILVVILQFQIKLVGFRPESNRDRMLYIMGIRADSRDSETRNSTAMSDGVVKECLYPLQTPEAVTAIASGKVIVSLSDRQLFEEYVIKYTDPGFWKVFDFRFISGKPFTEADFFGLASCGHYEYVGPQAFRIGRPDRKRGVDGLCAVCRYGSGGSSDAGSQQCLCGCLGSLYQQYELCER